MNKKLLALLLAILMVAVSACAMADEVDYSNQTADGSKIEHYFDITKNYSVGNGADSSVIKPEQTFTFEVVGKNPANPGITVDRFVFTSSTGDTVTNTLTIPTVGNGGYPAQPGVYEYTLKEVVPAGTSDNKKVQGITYDESVYDLKVTVINNPGDDGNPNYDTVISLKKQGSEKKDSNATFKNTYDAGQLTIKKTLAGTGAVSDDTFKITVTFAAEDAGHVIATDTIKAPEDAVENDDGSYTITLGHNGSATFTNVPVGTKYTVTEDAKVYEGNTETVLREYTSSLTESNNNGSIAANAVSTVDITNTLNMTNIDTGVNTDNTPYILLMALVAIMALAFVAKKRSVRE